MRVTRPAGARHTWSVQRNPRNVLVVGGGIGGLVLARALAHAGVAVDLLEQATSLRAVGAGITLGANAMRVLAELGLADAVARRGLELGTAAITDASGRTLASTDFAAIAARHGKGYAIHRGALHEALASGLDDRVAIRCGESVASLRDRGTNGVEVETTGGDVRSYHAVIGADGLHSTVRGLAIGAFEPRYAGYTCWRWTGPADALAGSVEMWGRGKRVGLVPLADGLVYAFLVANAPAGTPGDPEQARVGAVRRRFAEFRGDAPAVLAAMGDDDTRLLHHDICEIELPCWSDGAVGLLGDAAHAMTPNFGQGAAMAIEDAMVLARELVAHDDAHAALRAYERRRRARVDGLQRGARRLGEIAQWHSPVATWMRDLAVRMSPARSSVRAVERIVAYQA